MPSEPRSAEAQNNLGIVLREQGKLQEAIACYEKAFAIKPDYAEAYSNLGAALVDQAEFDDALGYYGRALTLDPHCAEAHFGESWVRLLLGEFDVGWPKYEWRWLTKKLSPHGLTMPLWDGKNLHGKTILLHCEQGLGDSIQMIRYARAVKEKEGRVLVFCPTPLEKLFRGVAGIDELFSDHTVIPSYECHAPLLSLPHLLGTTLTTIPSTVPYVQTDPNGVKEWQDRLVDYPGFRIGVVWRGNPTHKNDHNRSMTARDFASFLDVPGITVISLQKDIGLDELKVFRHLESFFDGSPRLADFADTASVISNLDLVISVDTAVCHLAGALGVPVWTLIPFAPDWRWLLDRVDSPWYPTMRLFRQKSIGDWHSVIQQVRSALLVEKRATK